MKGKLAAFGLAAAAALCAAAPSGAAQHNAADLAACNALLPDAARGVGSLDAGVASLARGGRVKEPPMSGDTEIPAGAVPKPPKRFAPTIPVHFHVISTGPTAAEGNVPLSQIQAQIDVLNRTFNGFYGGADTPFSFRLASVDRTTNAAWYAMQPNTKAERDAKSALHRGGLDALNLYSVDGGAFLGWATFPKAAPGALDIDGVVFAAGSLPGGTIANYDLGFTATHEVGHWLGLYHTFQNGCAASGDRIDDTPRQRFPTSGCPVGQDSCAEPGLDPIHNYMDYSFDACYEEFTAGQSRRMTEQYLYYRAP